MRPSSRLDLLLVPTDPVIEVDRGRSLLEELRSRGILDASDGPGPLASTLVEGGFFRAALELPDGPVGFWANRQGGFTVRCPVGDAPVVEAFSAAHAAWRERPGPPPTVACPACRGSHRADELVFRPAVAWGRFAVVVGRAEDSRLQAEAGRRIERWLGPFVVVLRRG